jgi:hypothetical protein
MDDLFGVVDESELVFIRNQEREQQEEEGGGFGRFDGKGDEKEEVEDGDGAASWAASWAVSSEWSTPAATAHRGRSPLLTPTSVASSFALELAEAAERSDVQLQSLVSQLRSGRQKLARVVSTLRASHYLRLCLHALKAHAAVQVATRGSQRGVALTATLCRRHVVRAVFVSWRLAVRARINANLQTNELASVVSDRLSAAEAHYADLRRRLRDRAVVAVASHVRRRLLAACWLALRLAAAHHRLLGERHAWRTLLADFYASMPAASPRTELAEDAAALALPAADAITRVLVQASAMENRSELRAADRLATPRGRSGHKACHKDAESHAEDAPPPHVRMQDEPQQPQKSLKERAALPLPPPDVMQPPMLSPTTGARSTPRSRRSRSAPRPRPVSVARGSTDGPTTSDAHQSPACEDDFFRL